MQAADRQFYTLQNTILAGTLFPAGVQSDRALSEKKLGVLFFANLILGTEPFG